MISLEKLSVLYDQGTVIERWALRDLTLRIQPGQYITVIGGNGAGKSTLLNVIAGEIAPTKGSIVIDGQDVSHLTTYKRSSFVSRVFQDPIAGTCSDLTIAQNLSLAHSRGKDRDFSLGLNKHLLDKFQTYLARLNLSLENRLHTPMCMLSGGQRQAVSLLMATIAPVKILLLDEYTSALDPKTEDVIAQLTNQIIEEKNLTVLQVTHSLHHALHFGNRTIMLNHGNLVYDIEGKEREDLTIVDLLAQFGSAL